MGLNITGIIINKSFRESLRDFATCFNWHIAETTETLFDYALENKAQKDYVDFYFTPNGTLTFLWEAYYSHFSLCDLSAKGRVINFVLSETSMFFAFRRYENDERNGEHFFVKDQSNNWVDKGKQPFLSVSKNDDLIFKTFSEILKSEIGKSLQEISLSEKVQRCKVKF